MRKKALQLQAQENSKEIAKFQIVLVRLCFFTSHEDKQYS